MTADSNQRIQSSCNPASSPISIKGPTSPQSSLLASGQSYILIPEFTLSSGEVLTNVPLAYKTWGKLNPKKKDNALLVSHALTGSADVEDWWGPLLGPDKLFDPTRFFIICVNVLGSPYGSAGPCTRKNGEQVGGEESQGGSSSDSHWDGKGWWGPEFPQTTVRDDVRIQKLLLDFLGVEQIAAVVGGSMGGMAVLEWPLLFPIKDPSSSTPSSSLSSSSNGTTRNESEHEPYIKAIVPIATCARHSAWGISWAEAQRQSIYSDPSFSHGYYDPKEPPRSGLAAARMAALLTYRSRDSFESRFGRRTGKAKKGGGAALSTSSSSTNQTQGNHSATFNGNGNLNGNGIHADSNGRRASEAHNEGNRSPIPRVLSNQPFSNDSIESINNTHFSGVSKGQERGEGEATTTTEGKGQGNLIRPTATTPPLSPTAVEQIDSAIKTSDALSADLEKVDLSNSNPSINSNETKPKPQVKIFSAQSYLRYQGDKFVQRFDANCYIHLTRKMDAHDVARGRTHWGIDVNGETSREILEREEELDLDEDESSLARVLSYLGTPSNSTTTTKARLGSPPPPKVLIISIESDGLFAPPEQILIHNLIPGSVLKHVVSPDGHDGFLLEFEQINEMVQGFLREVLKDSGIYEGEGVGFEEWKDWGKVQIDSVGDSKDKNGIQTGGTTMPGKVKESVFGEVEDITRW